MQYKKWSTICCIFSVNNLLYLQIFQALTVCSQFNALLFFAHLCKYSCKHIGAFFKVASLSSCLLYFVLAFVSLFKLTFWIHNWFIFQSWYTTERPSSSVLSKSVFTLGQALSVFELTLETLIQGINFFLFIAVFPFAHCNTCILPVPA
jgi:hypothetical protein